MSDLESDIFGFLIAYLPLYVTSVVGLVVAYKKLKLFRKPALLMAGGAVCLFLSTLAFLAYIACIVHNNVIGPGFSQTVRAITLLPWTLLLASGIVLMMAAAFAGRKPVLRADEDRD